MCFASSVRLAYFLSRNDTLCCVYRCLNVVLSCVVFVCGHVGFVDYAGDKAVVV